MVPYGQDHGSDTRLFPVLIFKFPFLNLSYDNLKIVWYFKGCPSSSLLFTLL